jgi:hypothetical protein
MPEKCMKCGHNLTVLFYTKDCGRCSNKTSEWFYHGYVLWTIVPDQVWDVQEHPVFKSAEEVGKWWKSNQTYLASFMEVREVLSNEPFEWIPMTYFNCEVADTRYKVTSKLTKEKPAKPTVIIIPADVLLPEGEKVLLNKEDRKALGIEE